MAGSWDGSYDPGSQSDESHHFERSHLEPIYDSFVCPLTKQVMRDPITLENGQTFEREAIEKWFKECKESGRKLVCPLTLKELRSTDLNPSIALRHTIEEWTARNEAVQLDMARRSLSLGSQEVDILLALKNVQYLCLKSRSNKHIVRNADLIPMIVDMLKSGSRRVRCRALETLRIVAEEDAENKEIMAEGDTIRTIVKFLSHELSKEREEAVSLLYELSKSETLCEKIGSLNGAILILVGMTSSKSENLLTVEKADKTLENLEMCENNIRQMAENGRLHPLLTQILEGPPETKLSMATYLGELVLNNDMQVFVARTVGLALINMMKSGNLQLREAALKALNQISSFDASARVLIEEGILPPLIKDLLTVGTNQLPMRLKESTTYSISLATLARQLSASFFRFLLDSPILPLQSWMLLQPLKALALPSVWFSLLRPHRRNGLLSSCQDPYNLAAVFTELLQSNGLDKVQMVSAMSLENLSQESKNLTKLPELPAPGFCASIFPCLSKQPVITGLCRLHRGTCSLKDSFCLLEGQAVEKLVALLDHQNEQVVEAALAAISTLRAVWAVERILRTDEIAYEISGDPNVSTALVDAFQHADYRTRQIAERALKHVDKIPNFSGIFPNIG
ncbi:unnamed protein product, partial [Vitis vinifera]